MDVGQPILKAPLFPVLIQHNQPYGTGFRLTGGESGAALRAAVL